MRTETSGVNDGSVSPTSLLAVPHAPWRANGRNMSCGWGEMVGKVETF